jgi:exodeoxyribonuclease-3
MKMVSWNVNGIRAIVKKDFLGWFNSVNADIVCTQETKATLAQYPQELTQMPDYNFYCASAVKKGYSGVAVWTKQKPISVKYGVDNKEFDSEGRVLRLDFKKFIFFTVYFPSGGASNARLQFKLKFYDFFIDYLSKIKNKDIIIGGDFNTAHTAIDLARPKENEKCSGFMPIEREKLDELIAGGFVDTFRQFNSQGENYTWWDYKTSARQRNVGWRLDYFFVNKRASKYLKDAEIYPQVMGSDHCPISIDIY